MKKTTKKQQRKNREKTQIKKKLIELTGHRCSGCGSHNSITLSHLIPVGQNKSLGTDIRNCVLDCIECHNIWEHKPWEEKATLFDFRNRLEKVSYLDPQYFMQQYIKMPEWMQEKYEYLTTKIQ